MAEEPANGPNQDDDGLTPFQRFERLTKKLVSVPKSEIDELEKRRKKRPRPAPKAS